MTQSRRSDVICKSEPEGHWSSLSKRSFLFPVIFLFSALCFWSALWTCASCSQTEGCFSVCGRMWNVTFLLWGTSLPFYVRFWDDWNCYWPAGECLPNGGENLKSMLMGINDKCWHSDQPMQTMMSSCPPGKWGYEQDWMRGGGTRLGTRSEQEVQHRVGVVENWAAVIQALRKAFKSKSSHQGSPCSAWHAKPPFCCTDVMDPAVAINSSE